MTAFHVIIPARLASTRLPNKPLADISGKPMVVRVAEQAAKSGAAQVVVATDSDDIVRACAAHGVRAILTSTHHASGSDRLAQACEALGLADDAIVVNVQGDEPLIEPELIAALAENLKKNEKSAVATASAAINSIADWHNPNVVKVVCNAHGQALYFSRAPIPAWRDGPAQALPSPAPQRHIGVYAYRAGFLKSFPKLSPSPLEALESLEQLRVLHHGHSISVLALSGMPEGGVDTPQDLERVRQTFASRIEN